MKTKVLAIAIGLLIGFATPTFAQSYTVKKGDTIAKIATENGINVTSITEVNSIPNVYNVQVGTILTLPTQREASILNTAFTLLGTTPYVWGGSVPYKGMDCSGYVQWVFKQHGISLPRTAETMWTSAGNYVSAGNLQVGDLVFLSETNPAVSTSNNYATHVGIYVGNGKFIEESSAKNDVVVVNLWTNSYYTSHYLGAKRVL